MNERNLKELTVAKLPKDNTEEDRGLDQCCENFIVLASITSGDSFKNDIRGVFHKKTSISDSVDFVIEKCGGSTLPNLGEIVSFPNDFLAVGFIYDWRQYLINHGVGVYKISKTFNILGVDFKVGLGTYELREFSVGNASGTVRVLSEVDSYSRLEDIDFTDSKFRDSIRFDGLFGEMKPKPETNQLIDNDFISVKTTRVFDKRYILKTSPISNCVSQRLIDFHLLHEDKCLLSDHNKLNHSYKYQDISVVLNEIEDPEYVGRYMKLTAVFADRKLKYKTQYNKK